MAIIGDQRQARVQALQVQLQKQLEPKTGYYIELHLAQNAGNKDGSGHTPLYQLKYITEEELFMVSGLILQHRKFRAKHP